MNARLYDRLAATVSIALLVLLAAGSYFLAEVAQRFVQTAGSTDGRDVADAFGEGIVLMRLNEMGKPVFRMTADRLEHFRRSDSTVYFRPALATLDPSQPRVTVAAVRGYSQADSRETRLEGDVQLDRLANAGEPALRISTDFVRIFSDSEVVLTDRPVRISRGDSTLTGTGMEFDNRARRLRVDAQAKAVWTAERRNP